MFNKMHKKIQETLKSKGLNHYKIHKTYQIQSPIQRLEVLLEII